MRYLPTTDADKKAMLERIGVKSMDDLFYDVPDAIRLKKDLDLGAPMSEYEIKKDIMAKSGRNRTTDQVISFLGAGVYEHLVPVHVDTILQRSEWYTAYTPYQAEVSQGTLQNIFEYQTMVCELFGMEVANASIYDGATALAEAMIMTCDRKRPDFVVSGGVHPEYIEVLRTYAHNIDANIKVVDTKDDVTPLDAIRAALSDQTGAVVVQYPNFFGNIEDLQAVSDAAKEAGATFVVATGDPVALGVLEAPGRLGADIVVGEGLGFVGAPGYSGPSIGLFATTKKMARKMPGRIVGMTKDKDGTRAFCMVMAAREQHIRREKASSNICTNMALHALAVSVNLSTLGPEGLREMAQANLENAAYAKERFSRIPGVSVVGSGISFNEFVLKMPIPVAQLNAKLLEEGVYGPLDLGRFFPERTHDGLFFVNELRTKDEIDQAAKRMEVIFGG